MILRISKQRLFFALSPFQIFISFFEIKDIILIFTFTASYALIKHLKIAVSTVDIIELAFLCFISEQIRSGMGVIPIVLLVIDKVKKRYWSNKATKNVLVHNYCGYMCSCASILFWRLYIRAKYKN